ncbi:MAG: hypothetical protein ACI9MS_003203 [Glaciecola sp.]|jgi:hypothetical protein
MKLDNLLVESDFKVFKGIKNNMPLTLSVKVKARFLKFALQNKMCLHLDKIQVFDRDGNNVALNSYTFVSSMYNDDEKYDGQGVVNGEPKGGCGHHTKTEDDPWLIIDLKKDYDLSKIVVFNRDDAHYHRALSLIITASCDLENWHKLFDNYAYKLSNDYIDLAYENKCLLNCSTLDIEPIRKLIKKLNSEGNKQQALSLLAKGNVQLEPYNLSIGPHGLTRTFSIRTENEKNKAYLALSNLLNVINKEFGVPAFASSGTLLGLVREGQFLGHDDDLDLCYISAFKEHDDILRERQELTKFLNNSGYKVTNARGAHLWCTTPQRITIDIFTGWVVESNCVMHPLPIVGVPKESLLPLKIEEYNGFDLYVPRVPVDLLELNYGRNWECPDPLWVFDWGNARKSFNFLYF